MAPPVLNLYHVSRPEPRASWVFNLSKFTHPNDKRGEPAGPPPERIASTKDHKRPSLGGLVWVNATLGGHCCLQQGSKTKAVTDIPIGVLDGWLNGQSGLWWLGALKEGHRTPWEGHVVMSWAMVFIPTVPEVSAADIRFSYHVGFVVTPVPVLFDIEVFVPIFLDQMRASREEARMSRHMRLPRLIEGTRSCS